MSSRKRKLSDTLDDSDHDNAAVHPFVPRSLPHPKRRRFDLARNLSRLSLLEQAQAQATSGQEQAVFQASPLSSQAPNQDVIISPWSPPYLQGPPEDATMDTDVDVPIPVITHPLVEEPTEQAIATDIRMRHTSSYEPEKDRIVVTDLDSSEDEDETPLQTYLGKDSTYSVSPAFLSRINASTPLLTALPPKAGSDTSQALVLFRPSPWSAKDARELEQIYRARDEEKPSKHHVEPQIQKSDADAMEIE